MDRYILNQCHFPRCNYKDPHWRILDREAPMCMPIEDFDGDGAEDLARKRLAELLANA